MTTPSDPFATPPERGAAGQRPPSEPPASAPGWGAQPGGYGEAPAGGGSRNGLGTTALVVGILALLTSWLVVGGLLGLVAIGLGIAGLIIAAGAALWNNDGFQNLTECLQDAGDDTAAQEECQRDFESELSQ